MTINKPNICLTILSNDHITERQIIIVALLHVTN